MSQWGQPGMQYPMQTGYNPQFQQQQQPQQQQQFQQQQPQQAGYQGGFQAGQQPGFQGGQQTPGFQGQGSGFQQGGGMTPQMTGLPGQQQRMQPQATGFPGMQTPQQGSGFQQPQRTGYAGSGFLQSQPTGYQGMQQQSRSAPPVPPIPSRFQSGPQQQQQVPQQTGYFGQQQQTPNRFLSASPGLQSQPTGMGGMGGGMRPLVPQATGFVDPRMQLMGSTFLPSNPSAPYNPAGAPQLPSQQQGGMSLQQGIQEYNQNQMGVAQPKLGWALSKAEKKKYEQIFRAWDGSGSGFIGGGTALEVFGQSGLSKDDLARVWGLADSTDRGKLNIAEFHVAMGLIYRKISGMPIPETLPQELIPPSARDLDASVDFLKDILKHDTPSRSPSIDDPTSYNTARNRSLHSNNPNAGGARDASNYKHNDKAPPGGFYQPRSRHVDRDNIRGRNEDDSPASDLSDMKRQLANSARQLDRSIEDDNARSASDAALEQEMSDLRFRVRRLQEDLDYVSRGPRTSSKEDERRKLEREMMKLMHERIPDVERRIEESEGRKERERREWGRERDRRNERFGRYDDRDSYDSSSRLGGDRDRERDRPYSRGGDRDRPYSRGADRDEYRRDRSRSRERDRPRSPVGTAARTPPPAPPPSTLAPAASRPAPSASPAPVIKNMTPEERKAYARAEAQRRVEARMAALGVTVPASSSSGPTSAIDMSVEDRMRKDKEEAEERARKQEEEREERERARRERVDGERAARGTTATPAAAATPPAPTPPAVRAPPAAPPAPTPRSAPPPPKPRNAPPPPAPRAAKAAAPPSPAPVEPEVDPEEEAMLKREAALRKQREARAERMRLLDEEEAEARKAEEEYQARRKAFLSGPAESQPATPVVEPGTAAPPPAPPAPPPPPAPPAPPPPAVTSPPALAATTPAKSKSNPFSKMMQDGAPTAPTPPAAPAANANGSSNPFFRAQTAPPPTSPAPARSPAPGGKTSYNTAPGDSDTEDWGDVNEKEDDDSSDDDIPPRDVRTQIANQLFGGMVARPQSTPAVGSTPPPAPGAPPPPPAPAAPRAPVVMTPSAGPADVNALMNSIRGGAALRKAKTVDRSGAALSGKVVGDSAPPAHINAAPVPSAPSPPPAPPSFIEEPTATADTNGDGQSNNHSHRQSVGWFAGMAADQQGGPGAMGLPGPTIFIPPTVVVEEDEEGEKYETPVTSVPGINVTHHDEAEGGDDHMADIDLGMKVRVRTLFPYEGQRNEDLSFNENLIIDAHPSKSNGDWWYGSVARDGKTGFFPRTYVEPLENVKAKALYDYAGSNADELPFVSGDILTIIDKTSEADWWKTEKGGVVFIVPAGYMEVVEG